MISLKEANKKKEQLKNDLNYYNNQRELNLKKVGVGAINYEKEVTSGGSHEDKFTNYLEFLEDKNKLTLLELDKIIENIQKEIEIINDWIEETLKIIRQYRDTEQLVIHYRDNGYTWEKIAFKTGYSSRQCQRIYDKYKKRLEK